MFSCWRLRRCLPLLAILALTAGCSSESSVKKVKVSGKLMEGDKPFVLDSAKLKLPKGASLPPGSQPLQVAFIPPEKGDTVFAQVDATNGTFTASLPAGKYRVAVTASSGPGAPDLWEGKFSAEKTQISRDVKDGAEIVIDLAKPGG